MLTGLTILGAYCGLCYATIGLSLWKSPGPGGFGILAVPFAPLFPPLGLFLALRWACRRLLGIR